MKYKLVNEWMSHKFHIFYKFVCQMCSQCMISVREKYKLWMNEFCMISITKLWDVKFVMKMSNLNKINVFLSLMD